MRFWKEHTTLRAVLMAIFVVLGFVLLIAQRVRQMPLLVVSGVMIGYICSAVTDFLINFAKEADIVNLTYWSMGTFSGKSWNDLKISSIIVIITLIVTFFMSKPVHISSARAMRRAWASISRLSVSC